ncbi:MAG: dihydrolipoyl dehydrogenase [Nitriliruptoraceae bacterium]
MAEVQLPQLGESVTEGIITRWLVDVGDTVTVDQAIAEISTDKVDTEIPSPVAGTIDELRFDVDDTVEVGQVIAIVNENATNGNDDTDDEDDPDEQDKADDKTDDEDDSDKQDKTDKAHTEDGDGGSAAATHRSEPTHHEATSAAPSASTGPRKRSDDHDADVIVLGGGTGGYSTALRAAQLGLDVILIEKAKVGGTCLHWGCIPTKAVLQSAEVAESAQEAEEFGVSLDYHGVEVEAINRHKDAVVDKMWKGLQGALKNRGVETVIGTGRLVSVDTIEVDVDDSDTRTMSAPSIVVATGSEPRELPFAPFDGKRVISSDHALHLDKLPKRAVVLGSGAVGMEFATAWNAFGVEVTVVELEDRLLPLEDVDSSKEIGRAFRRRGITAMTGVKLTDVNATQRSVTCSIDTGKGTEEIKADILLVAVGRGPVTEGAGLDAAGVEVDERGFVAVDDYCRTSVEGIWAVGDVIPTLGLAHASFAEGMLVADQLAGLDVTPIDYRGVPKVTYSHPEVASVGYSEAGAKDAGFEVVIEKYPLQALGRAAIANATGMVKLVAEKDDDAEGGAGRILGIHIVGPRATDLIAEGQLIYGWEALASDVAPLIHAHPSFSEAIGEAHLALAGRALHG